MLIRYKELIFNTAVIKTARREKIATIGRPISLVRIIFMDETEEQFTEEDVAPVWRLLCAAAKTSTQE